MNRARRGLLSEIPKKEVASNLAILLLKNGTELSPKVPYGTVIFSSLMYCHPTLTHVNSKSLIITLAHHENRRGSS